MRSARARRRAARDRSTWARAAWISGRAPSAVRSSVSSSSGASRLAALRASLGLGRVGQLDDADCLPQRGQGIGILLPGHLDALLARLVLDLGQQQRRRPRPDWPPIAAAALGPADRSARPGPGRPEACRGGMRPFRRSDTFAPRREAPPARCSSGFADIRHGRSWSDRPCDGPIPPAGSKVIAEEGRSRSVCSVCRRLRTPKGGHPPPTWGSGWSATAWRLAGLRPRPANSAAWRPTPDCSTTCVAARRPSSAAPAATAGRESAPLAIAPKRRENR